MLGLGTIHGAVKRYFYTNSLDSKEARASE